MSDLNLRIAALRGTIWSALRQAADQGIRMVLYLILARLVEPDAFGQFAMALVWTDMVGVCIYSGLADALVQKPSVENQHFESVLWSTVVLAVVVSTANGLAAPLVQRILRASDLSPILLSMSPLIVLATLAATHDAWFRRQLDFRTLAIRELVSRSCGALIGVFLAVRGHGIMSLVAFETTTRIVAVVYFWLVCPWRPRLRFSRNHLAGLLPFGSRMTGVALLNLMLQRGDNLLVGTILGARALGFYSIAKTLVFGLYQLVTNTLGLVATSMLSRLQDDATRFGRAVGQATAFSALVRLPAIAGLFLLADPLVRLLFTDTFAPAVPVARGLAAAAFVMVLFGHNRVALTALGRVDLRLGLEVLGAVAILGGVVVGSYWGVEGAALGMAVAALLTWPFEIRWSLRPLPIRWGEFARALAAPIVGTLMMMAAVGLALQRTGSEPRAGVVAALVALGAFSYVVTLLVVAPELVRDAFRNLRLAGRGTPDEPTPSS